MLFIRPARLKRNLISDKFVPKYAKSLFYIQNEHHNLRNEYENGNFQF